MSKCSECGSLNAFISAIHIYCDNPSCKHFDMKQKQLVEEEEYQRKQKIEENKEDYDDRKTCDKAIIYYIPFWNSSASYIIPNHVSFQIKNITRRKI